MVAAHLQADLSPRYQLISIYKAGKNFKTFIPKRSVGILLALSEQKEELELDCESSLELQPFRHQLFLEFSFNEIYVKYFK